MERKCKFKIPLSEYDSSRRDEYPVYAERRLTVCDIINKLCPQNSVGTEIGVLFGEMSAAILDNCSVYQMYMVDPYIGGYQDFRDSNDGTQEEMDERYALVRQKFKSEYPTRSTLIRKKSEAAHLYVPDLDFVYIDGAHTYQDIWKDLALWAPKVKKGGVVIGDDWNKYYPDVSKAAIKYFSSRTNCYVSYSSYEQFDFVRPHVKVPGIEVINRSVATWWVRKAP